MPVKTLPHDLVRKFGTAVDVPAFGGRLEVDWSPGERVTSVGGLVFFATFLKETGLFDRLCEDFPVCYRSNNSSSKRDIVGTAVLAIRLVHRYVIDVDNMVKPGRLSHNYHSFFIGRVRIALVPTAPAVVKQAEFDFVKDVRGREWDYCVLVTNDEKMDAVALSQLYRDRGDPDWSEAEITERKSPTDEFRFIKSGLGTCKHIERALKTAARKCGSRRTSSTAEVETAGWLEDRARTLENLLGSERAVGYVAILRAFADCRGIVDVITATRLGGG